MGKWVRIYIPNGQDANPCMLKAVMASASDHFRVQPEKIIGRSNIRRHSITRQACMYILRKRDGATYMAIADAFNRNHATVIHAVKRINELVELCEKHKAVMKEYREVYEFVTEAVEKSTGDQ